MKKTALIILLTAMSALSSFGQSAYDAWRFSQNEYEGTARSAAMGNAFTALGGDLGAITINPAGSAVAGYSQFTLTPSITISSATAEGVLPPGGSELTYFDKKYRANKVKAGIPNIGMTFHFDTGRKSGLKNVTVGFVVNTTKTWCENVFADGTNYTTSFAGAAAFDATENMAAYNMPGVLPAGEPRYSYLDLIDDNAYDYYSPWKDIVAYRGGMISTFDDKGETFIGATEVLLSNGNIQQGGPLKQTYGRSVNGNKTEYIFNVGANISDFVYVGFNLGFNTLAYDESTYFKEKAIDEYDFENIFVDENGNEEKTYFRNLIYKHAYSANGNGVFGKFGIIVTPGNGLRFGAAFQTPTSTSIRERWRESAETNFSTSKFDCSAQSPYGEYSYTFRSPFRANFGVAYTFGGAGLISADYEVASYGSMKYQIDRYNMADADIEYFESINDDIRQAYGAAHQFRLGAEFKPVSTLAVRAGYNLLTSAQQKYYDAETDEYIEFSNKEKRAMDMHNLSIGLGYISKKSFFADLACRYSFATDEYYMPYSDYQYDNNGNMLNYSPEILIRNANWKVLLTLGWRF